MFCFTTFKQQRINGNSFSHLEYWFSTIVNNCDIAVQFKYPIFSSHLLRTLHIVHSGWLLNLTWTYFKVAYLIMFTCLLGLGTNFFSFTAAILILPFVQFFKQTMGAFQIKITDWPDALMKFLLLDALAQWRKGEESQIHQLPRPLFVPAWGYKAICRASRAAFQAHNRLIRMWKKQRKADLST